MTSRGFGKDRVAFRMDSRDDGDKKTSLRGDLMSRVAKIKQREYMADLRRKDRFYNNGGSDKRVVWAYLYSFNT